MSGAAGPERPSLIEAALPLDAIAAAVARDAAVSPLHLWWSHKPAAACRAALFAALVDDPGYGLGPEEGAAARAALSDLTARVAAGDAAALDEARQRLAQAYPGGLPTVVDPFCGSGAIPCEARRLGLPVFASDLNPVAVLATAALIDFPGRFAGAPPVHPATSGPSVSRVPARAGDPGLAADVRSYGRVVQREALRRVGHLYPAAPTGEPVLAWIWCRTACCPNPACGAEMPLVHSFSLSTRPGKPAWVHPALAPATGGGPGAARPIRFRVGPAAGVPEPPPGTFTRGGAHCLTCGEPVPLSALRRQAQAHGLGLRLLAIVGQGRPGRRYLPPDPEHEALAARAAPAWAPDTEIPARALGVGVAHYGLRRHRDLFTPRQLAALGAFSDAVRAVHPRVEADARRAGLAADGLPLAEGGQGAAAYADAVCTYLAFALDRAAVKWCSLARWQRSRENIEHPFASPGLQMAWDFAEANPFSTATGNWLDAVDAVADALERAPRHGPRPTCRQMDAAAPDGLPAGGLVVCTDPPYFANLPYADTSDLFYVWLRRTLADVFPHLLRTVLTPKDGELVADPHRHGGRAAARKRFEEGMRTALASWRAHARPDRPMTLYYALRQARPEAGGPGDGARGAEGWAAMLESLLSAGFRITGTWPLRTEHAGRRRSLGSNALASTILLVCRPRAAAAPEASLREVRRELRQELPRAAARFTAAGVAPVDLAQAAIGPGMAVFSRYRRVLAADGTPVSVAAALRLINEELDAALAQGEGDLDAESRFCLAWFEQHGARDGPYGDADVLARAKNTGMAALERLRLVEARAGRVRLLAPAGASAGAPGAALPCAWLVLHGLTAALQRDGEAAAAAWLRPAPPETAAALRPLAYRFYAAAERLGLQAEARSCGAAVAAWDEIETLARSGARAVPRPEP